MANQTNTTINSQLENLYIANKHPEYCFWYSVWKKNQDCVDGQISIKRSLQSLSYLPMLAGHKNDKTGELYKIYKQYAVWFNGTNRTVEGIVGLIFRKDPVINIPDSLKPVIDDIDYRGQSLYTFVKKVVKQIIIKNRVGILVDFPLITNEFNSLSDYESSGVQPYAQMYKAENILNWREEKNITTFVSLYESEYSEGATEFDSVPLERIRVLELVNGLYQQTIYEKTDITAASNTPNSETMGWTLKEVIEPKINGARLNYVPFCVITKDGIGWELDYSAINDLADMNIAHYRNSASYENALILTGNPTPILVGYNSEDEDSIVLGSSQAISLNEGGRWGFLTIGPGGLSELRTAMDKKAESMAMLGGKILATETKDSETAETASIHKEGEQSVLTNIANNASEGIEKVLKMIGQWAGLNEKEVSELEYVLNTDFSPTKMTPQEMTSLLQMVMAGKLSDEEFYENIKRGELVRGDKTFEEHVEEIENSSVETNVNVQAASNNVEDEEIDVEEDDEQG